MRRHLVLLSLGLVLAQATPAAAADCTKAEELAAFDLDAARTAYTALLALPAPPPCARPGFDKVATRRRTVAVLLSRAQDAATLGDKQGSGRLIAQALVLDPANDAARTLLDGLAAPTPTPDPTLDPYAGAKALLDADYDEDAREQARKVAAAEGSAIPSPLASPAPSLAERAKDGADDITDIATGLAILVAVLAAAAALAVKFGNWLVRRRHVTLGTFSVVQDDEPAPEGKPDAGVELKTIVAEELAEAARSSSTFRTVEAAAVDVPQPVGIPEQLKPVANLIQIVFRRAILEVSATARAIPDGGWQVTAQIRGRRRVFDQVTFRVESAAGPGVSPAGIWIAAWAMLRLHGHVGWFLRRSACPFGTDNWESLAWLRFANAPGIPGELVVDRLHRALLADHDNVVALAALGGLQTQHAGDTETYRTGLTHLDLAAEALARKPTRRTRIIRGQPPRAHAQFEPLWFQIAYARTIAHLHRYHFGQQTKPPTADPQDREAGIACALDLARTIAATWLTLDGWWWRARAVGATRRAELVEMLDRDDEYHLGVLAGALMTGHSGPLPPAAVQRKTGRQLWEWVAASADDLRTPEPLAELLHVVTHPSSHAHADTLYNIACVWAQAGEPDKAVAVLRQSFDHYVGTQLKRDLEWLEQDYTLHSLRGMDAYVKLVDDLRKRVTADEPPGAPAGAGNAWMVAMVVAP